MRVAFFSGCIEYSVCLVNALCNEVEIDFFYNGDYVRQRDATILDLLDSRINRMEINQYRIRDPKNYLSHRNLARKLREYDIVHVQQGNVWLSMNRHLFKNVPMVCTVHDPTQHVGLRFANSYYQHLAQRWIARQSSAFIVHGVKMKAELTMNFKLHSDLISVIPHGEFSYYKTWRSENDPLFHAAAGNKRLLFFGEARKNKGLEYLIRAEPLITEKFKDFTICIAGRFTNEPGNDFAFYAKLMTDPSKYEIFNRYIANNEVAEIFEQSDIVVLPYVSASQSGVLALALGFGKPVVATDTGSIGEVLEHGKTGLLVLPKDPTALANALSELLINDERLESFGENAVSVAQSTLSWETIGRQTTDVYRSLH
ncbi:MAG: glycosyltransferase family 4 protein [Desulfuromonadaceae bacterium]